MERVVTNRDVAAASGIVKKRTVTDGRVKAAISAVATDVVKKGERSNRSIA